jgi:5'-nucleotidase
VEGVRILVTNDDSVYSPALLAMADAASAHGEVRVVAPDVEQSSMAHAITSARPLRFRRARVGKHVAFRVDGTPADCVAIGMHTWGNVDVVLSGINLGLNVGNSMWHSGTLAAAKQAALLGCRGVALSAGWNDEESFDYEPLMPWLDRILTIVLERSRHPLLNVNFPERPQGIRWTRQSVRHYAGKVFPSVDPLGRSHYWFAPVPLEPAEEGTDRWAVENGLVSITPLRLDLTDMEELKRASLD